MEGVRKQGKQEGGSRAVERGAGERAREHESTQAERRGYLLATYFGIQMRACMHVCIYVGC